MARKKPISGKARRIKLLTSRAAKQPVITPHPADVIDPTLVRPSAAPLELPATSSRPSGIARHRTAEDSERQSRKDVQLRLESRFLRLPLDLLNHHRLVAATEALCRPIPAQLGYCLTQDLQPEALKGLTCPKRPKWNYAMSKLEVEKNEEGVFKKWLASTDETLSTFASSLPSTPAPSFYERNLQVWRQLWRVTEASEILLVLVDVRFPLIHYPPSLEEFCRTLKKKQKIIIVLTKTDLVPTWLSEGWKAWFEEREGPDGADVVLMESYKEIERHALTQGTQARYVPAAPTPARNSLISALKKAHQSLLQPPPAVADFPDRLARWSPNLRVNVDWDSIENPDAETEATGSSTVPPVKEKKVRRNKAKDAYVPRRKRPNPGDIDEPIVEEVVEEEAEEVKPVVEVLKGDAGHPFLSIGLIGQPNVGKSSLLNALLQRKVVRASRTPGKTKSLQTIFWNDNLRLVDCPGLVCPSFAGMERQVLSGILPIQNVEPVLYFISQRLPLENILKLNHPDLDVKEEDRFWTCDDILNSFAELYNYKTAKAGRNDLYRAGSVILRQMHNSAIPWAFRPPSNSPTVPRPKEGIFIPDFKPKATSATSEAVKRAMEEEEADSNTDDEEEDEEEQSGSGSDEEEEDDPAEAGMFSAIRSAFAGLEVQSGGSDEEESSAEESS